MQRIGLIMALFCAVATGAFGQPARRIVSTAPSITETLFALGLGKNVVGVSQYCEYPAEVKALPKVGSYVQPNLEAIVRLRPDLVLGESAANQVGERLEGFGIRYAVVPHGSLAETFAGVQTIAAAAGVAERGTALVGRMKAGLNAVRARAGRTARVRVLMIVDRRPGTLSDLIAVGPGNYEDEVIAAAGGINVLATGMSYPRISLETVLREQPEVIVDLTDAHGGEGDERAARVADATLWAREKGLKSRVYLADTTIFVVPGPRVPDAAEKLYEVLHP